MFGSEKTFDRALAWGLFGAALILLSLSWYLSALEGIIELLRLEKTEDLKHISWNIHNESTKNQYMYIYIYMYTHTCITRERQREREREREIYISTHVCMNAS